MHALVFALLVGALGANAVSLRAQADTNARPPGWMVRTDDPQGDAAPVSFVDMPPGWHITTGPAAILWNGAMTAEGDFTVELEAYLFDPGELRQPFGLLLGGSDLSGEGQSYLNFLIREGGAFLVERRRGNQTETLIDWSPAPSMISYATKPRPR